MSLPIAFSEKVTRLGFVAGDTRLFVERWVPPALPQRWLIDLAVNDGSAKEFVLWAELLSDEHSLLGAESRHLAHAPQGTLPPDEALLRATTASLGPRPRLSKEECRELWRHF
jgi:hypothetical protein